MEGKTTIKVKEWFFDKVYEEAKKYHIYLNGKYKVVNGVEILDHTTLRVDEVLKETEKAVQVVLDAETESGSYYSWKTWIPKSVIE